MVVTTTSRTCAELPRGAGTHQTRPSRQARRYLAAGLAATVFALAGCSSAASQSGPGGHAKVSLTFQLNHGPGTAVVKHWTLNCEPSGGSQAHADVACAVLLKLKHPFAPPPQGVACPMIIFSNKKIVVTGTWFGVRVHRIVIDGGCDIALFKRLDSILS